MAGNRKRRRPGAETGWNRTSHTLKTVSRVLDEADRMAKGQGAYCESLQLQDESELRSLEDGLSRVERKALRAYLLKYVDVSTPKMDDVPILERVAKKRPYFDDCFSSALVGLVSAYCNGLGCADTPRGVMAYRQELEEIASRIPKQFLGKKTGNPQVLSKPAPFTDPISAGLYYLLDWDSIMRGDNIALWARNAAKVVDSVLPPDAFEHLRLMREAIVIQLAGAAAEEISLSIENASKYIAETVPARVPQIKDIHPIPGAREPFIANPLTPSLPLTPNAGILPLKPDNLLQDDTFWDLPLCQAALARVLATDEASYQLSIALNDFDMAEIAYAAITLMAQYNAISAFPGIVMSLGAFLAIKAYACNPEDFVYSDEDAKRDRISINTSRLCSLPEEAQEALLQLQPGDCANDEDGALIPVTVSQMLYGLSEMAAPPILQIDIAPVDTMEAVGYSRDEAMALCGFAEGARSARESMTIALQENYLVEVEKAEAEEIAENALKQEAREAEIRAEAKREYEERMAEAQEIRQRAESLERQARRENRTTLYHAEKAKEQLAATRDERDELRIQVERLLAEKERLEEALHELGGQAESDEEEEPDVPLKQQFPSDIGRDVKFVVYGGPQNWAAEQRRRFPYIEFHDVEEQPNEASIAGADILMLNTFVMKHKAFDNIQDTARKNNIPLHYFLNKGINRGSEQMLELYDRLYGKDRMN